LKYKVKLPRKHGVKLREIMTDKRKRERLRFKSTVNSDGWIVVETNFEPDFRRLCTWPGAIDLT
jgi:hypothetical protein